MLATSLPRLKTVLRHSAALPAGYVVQASMTDYLRLILVQGTPVADFPNTSCNIPTYFQENNIIINLTFCGDWAGSVYGQSGCPSNCVGESTMRLSLSE